MCLVAARMIVRRSGLGSDELWDSHQIVGDEVEHEVGADSGDAAMPGLAHGAVLLAPSEDALDHCPARDAVADVAGGALVDGAGASFWVTCGVTLRRRKAMTWSRPS